MRSLSRLLVVGPSGSGKSFLLHAIRTNPPPGDRIITLDLDVVGYRRPDEAWTRWHINRDIFRIMASNARMSQSALVLAGCDSEPERLFAAARNEGMAIVCVIPSLEVLKSRRLRRGDAPEKVAEAPKSIASWNLLALDNGITVVSDLAPDNLDNIFKHRAGDVVQHTG